MKNPMRMKAPLRVGGTRVHSDRDLAKAFRSHILSEPMSLCSEGDHTCCLRKLHALDLLPGVGAVKEIADVFIVRCPKGVKGRCYLLKGSDGAEALFDPRTPISFEEHVENVILRATADFGGSSNSSYLRTRKRLDIWFREQKLDVLDVRPGVQGLEFLGEDGLKHREWWKDYCEKVRTQPRFY